MPWMFRMYRIPRSLEQPWRSPSDRYTWARTPTRNRVDYADLPALRTVVTVPTRVTALFSSRRSVSLRGMLPCPAPAGVWLSFGGGLSETEDISCLVVRACWHSDGGCGGMGAGGVDVAVVSGVVRDSSGGVTARAPRSPSQDRHRHDAHRVHRPGTARLTPLPNLPVGPTS